jgi:hypothetical protein
MVTASFRATATAARLKPTRSLNASPHVRSEVLSRKWWKFLGGVFPAG